MAFGLQFLDGVGNPMEDNVFPYDYENKEITARQMDDVTDEFESFSDSSEGETLIPDEYKQEIIVTTEPCNSEKWMKCFAVFVCGVVAGQVLKKLFKD